MFDPEGWAQWGARASGAGACRPPGDGPCLWLRPGPLIGPACFLSRLDPSASSVSC